MVWGAAMAVGADKSTTFLADTGTSHHIVHNREFFWEMLPLPGPFRINRVQGTVEGMDFNIVSSQKFRAANFIPVYDKVEGKVVINKRVPTRGYA